MDLSSLEYVRIQEISFAQCFSYLLKLENYLHVQDIIQQIAAASHFLLIIIITFHTNSRKGWKWRIGDETLTVNVGCKTASFEQVFKNRKNHNRKGTFDVLYSSFNWETYINPLIFPQRLVTKENIYRYYRNSHSTTNTSHQ